MSSNDREIDSLFAQAQQIESPERRAAFIKRQCGHDTELRLQVESLLLANEKMDADFMQQTNSLTASTASPDTSRTIGPYKLLQKIGEGGMGAVWMAEQEEPVRRRVALKLIRGDMDSREIVARFEAERQALAMMNHPNIARVLDTGTTDSGTPYFVMELVKGVPLNEFCDQNKLSIRERLELFVPICYAIQHAHQKGILHRDLKPSNVLIAIQDGKPFPKVIDFGLAKALEHTHRLTDKTLFTEFGKVVGTLQYMSPEQAEMSAMDVDTRTDIYSLGVMLYESLTGSTPLQKESLANNALLQVLALIRDSEPPLPSDRLTSSGEASTGISEQRRIAPTKLSQLLRGDLDWVVMKAIDKERPRRYETANGLASDIKRYLNDEPVMAAPPNASYKMRKFIRRNRAAVVTAGLVLLTLVAGIIGTTWSMLWALDQRKKVVGQAETASAAIMEANEIVRTSVQALNEGSDDTTREPVVVNMPAEIKGAEVDKLATTTRELAKVLVQSLEKEASSRHEAEKVADFQAEQMFIDPELMGSRLRTSLLDAAVPDSRKALEDSLAGINFTTLARGSLQETFFEQTLEAIDQQFAEQPVVQAKLLHAMGTHAKTLGIEELSIHSFERALALRREHLGATHFETLLTMSTLGAQLKNSGRLDDAQPLIVESYEVSLRKHGDLDGLLGTTALNLASLRFAQGNFVEAERLRRDTVLYANALGDEQAVSAARSSLTLSLIENGKLDEAEQLARELVTAARQNGEDNHLCSILNNLATVLDARAKWQEAEQIAREVVGIRRRILGDDHTSTLFSLNNLASALLVQGRLDEAERIFRENLATCRRLLGRDHPNTTRTIARLGTLLRDRGNLKEAESLIREAIEIRQETHGNDHPSTLGAKRLLARVFDDLRRFDESEPIHREFLAAVRVARGKNHSVTIAAASDLGLVLQRQGKLEKAEPVLREAMDGAKQLYGDDHWHALIITHNYARVVRDLGRTDEALPLLTEVAEKAKTAFPDTHAFQSVSMGSLGVAYGMAGRYPEGEPLLIESHRILSDSLGDGHVRVTDVIGDIADFYERWHESEPEAGHELKAAQWRERLEEPGDE